MSIAELGESLLARQRSRNDDIYRRTRRDAYTASLLTAGVGMLNNVVKNNAQRFLQDERVLATKARYKSAAEKSENILNIYNTATAEGKSMEDWFYENRYMPAMQGAFTEQYQDEGYLPSNYEPQLSAKARELAAAEAERFEEALRVAREIPDFETATRNLDNLVAPPANIGTALWGQVKGFFTGKKPEEVRSEIIDNVYQQGLIKNESIQDKFDTILARDGLNEAVEFARNIDTVGFERNDKYVEELRIFQDREGNIVRATVSTITKANGREVTVDSNIERVSLEDTAKAKADIFQGVVSQANYPARARELLTPKAYAAMQEDLQKRGVNIFSPGSPEEFSTLGRVVLQYTSAPENLQDKYRDDMTVELFSAMVTGNDLLIQSALSEDVEATTEEMGRILNRISETAEALSERISQDRPVVRGDPNIMGSVVDQPGSQSTPIRVSTWEDYESLEQFQWYIDPNTNALRQKLEE